METINYTKDSLLTLANDKIHDSSGTHGQQHKTLKLYDGPPTRDKKYTKEYPLRSSKKLKLKLACSHRQ